MTDISIQSLVGKYPNQIVFVEDYVQVGFNGPILTTLTGPIVEMEGRRWRFPEAGSRDALCALIRQVVSDVEVQDGESIRLRFAGGQTLTLPLDEASRAGPEAAHFSTGRAFSVW